ncbi:MAG TPA: restriction endonuclease, partial [Anaerolineae bacterium]|nr:restriction endonuclease [Anaerolineae bacterium]
MPFYTIHTEGGLLPADLLESILAGDAIGQAEGDFRLPRGARLSDEIAAAWADARAYWEAFNRGLRRLPEGDPAITLTRELWLAPLLRSLGYDDLTYSPRAAIVGNSTYAISHYLSPLSQSIGRGAGGEGETEGIPIHLTGCGIEMDRRPPTGVPRLSPHALMQEFLNRTEHLWGLVSNGYKLRLLRHSALMTRPAYIEFDLQALLAGEHFSDFTLLYRLLHRSHLPRTAADAPECWLERYYQQALDQGGRVRERLRDGVEQALLILGNGFLAQRGSEALRARLKSELPAPAYYRQLLRLVYRLLFLMVSEERGLVGPETAAQADIYRRYYGVTRLRDQAEGYLARDEHGDLWEGLKQTFRLYAESDIAARLGMAALDGDLFGPDALPDLEGAALANYELLRALRHLSLYRDERILRRVNYAALDVEELGSVYESLLDYHPVIETRDHRLTFAFVKGAERKTTGSYYTRPELVNELIKSALEPVIAERLRGRGGDKETRRGGDKERG